jgi:uncharacterized protein YabN with tetrapyrrole methylase and pyrophosphatase domain
VDVAGVDGVIRNWEQIKAEERLAHDAHEKNGLLSGVPMALPALSQAEQIIERVGRVGFEGLAALGDHETIQSLLVSFLNADAQNARVLTGRLLLAITVIAHQAGVDAEMALREALTRFRHRFSAMEEQALATGRNLMDLSAQEKARLWAMTSDENESASES